ncbi:hypothetical protein KHP07_19300 [Pseudomonas sp. VS40]|uniref:hypothetical protein n=1 Tax=unclassified Pseudomonas TaxID=196821 RepID=UPI001BDEE29C|nr:MULTISPECIES: hypothetical protein [unclassified Pseudomonas]MBT1262520.1 hypothetical protein [Pseudomonas sp. VS40]MBT1274543.1 hypothetical protein [Pseudomonas sp. VS59]
MKWVVSVFVSVFLICSTNAFSESSVVPPLFVDSVPVVSSPGVEKTISLKDSELLLLKDQNKLIKEFQSSQQTTVFWSLGIVASFVLVIMGLSYFTNFKFYEQDKDRIKSDFESRLVSYRAEVNLQLEESKREISMILDESNKVILDRVLLQLAEVRSTTENVRSELIAEIKSVEGMTAKFSEGLRSVDVKLANAEMELREVEMIVWHLDGVPENMLISLGQGLQAAAEAGNKHGVTRILESILEVIEEKFIGPGVAIEKNTVEMLTEDLNFARSMKVPGISKVKKALSQIPLEKEADSVV